ncbi:hypothetical protein [Zoogloea sp.]|uniref:hypothetical protein n=1 Tax=Zoogloea sp. TaxID=49181 RepID=UPI0025FEF391|nr:hypothetical protein [Zoogloea sp.]MCK6395811.1 hypothetical protein [Zoogloea sp.]
MTKPSLRFVLALATCAAVTGGCEQLGIPDPVKVSAQAEAEGKAIGSACRHAGRAIEDCYTLNTTASKAAVFAGWKEMNDYMVENKIAEVVPLLPPPPPPAPPSSKKKKAADHGSGETGKDKPASAEGGDHAEADSPAKAEADTPPESETRKRRRSRE